MIGLFNIQILLITPSHGIYSFNPKSLSQPGTPSSMTSADPSSSNSADSVWPQSTRPHLCRSGLIDSPYCPLHPQSSSICDLNHLFFQCPHLSQLRQTLYTQLLTNNPPSFTASDLISLHNLHAFPAVFSFILSLSLKQNLDLSPISFR